MIPGKMSKVGGIALEAVYSGAIRRYLCPKCGTRMKPITKGLFASKRKKRRRVKLWVKDAYSEFNYKRWKCPACGRRMTAKKLERIKMETMGREAYERRKKILTILFNVIWISAAVIWLYLQYKKTIG